MAAPLETCQVPFEDWICGEWTAGETGKFHLLGGTLPISHGVMETDRIFVQAKHANTGIVRIGNNDEQTIELAPGQGVWLPVRAKNVFVYINAGDGINYLLGRFA